MYPGYEDTTKALGMMNFGAAAPPVGNLSPCVEWSMFPSSGKYGEREEEEHNVQKSPHSLSFWQMAHLQPPGFVLAFGTAAPLCWGSL